jgi:hypothetical protein
MIYLLNAFSLNMIVGDADLLVRQVGIEAARNIARVATSAVGHADTAAVFSDVLGVDVPTNRVSVTLNVGDLALVGQYSGPRLPEGATTLPEGAAIKWLVVGVREE